MYLGEAAAESKTAASGREYMLQKQQERRRAAEADAQMNELALVAHDRLAALSVDARANPLQRPELSGRRERMLLNGAYLVAAGRVDAFAEAVDALRTAHGRDGVELELTGPWPAYNFADA
jgi:hypothetical protein